MRLVPYMMASVLFATSAAAQVPEVVDLPGLQITVTRTMSFDTFRQTYVDALAFCTQDLPTDIAERDRVYVRCMTDTLAEHDLIVTSVTPVAQTKIT